MFDGRMMLVQTAIAAPPVPAGFDARAHQLLLIDSMHVISRSVAQFEKRGTISDSVPGAHVTMVIPFQARPEFRVSPSGRRIAFAECGCTGGEKASIHLVVWSGTGDTVVEKDFPTV